MSQSPPPPSPPPGPPSTPSDPPIPRPPRGVPACADCGGTRIANIGLLAVDGGYTGLQPFGQGRSDGSALGPLAAYVCTHCGMVKLYANDLTKVRRVAQQHPEWFLWSP